MERKNAIKTSRSVATGDFLHKDMMAFATRLSQDPDAARGFLQRAGIVTRSGKIAKAYGG
ncbi:MAG: hypothetical protein WC742_12985 [Gallionellaceae bacterium]